MRGKNPALTELVRSYVNDPKYSKVNNMALAKILFKDHPQAFKDVESARCIVRNHRGAHGGRMRKVMRIAHNSNPFHELESQYVPREPVHLPKGCDNILLISDLHIPYQDNDAVWVAIKKGKEMKVNTVIINGDIMDAYHLSTFHKDQRKRNTAFEISECKKFLGLLRKQFPNAKIYLKKGNHDARYDLFLQRQAPQLLDIPDFEFAKVMGVDENRICLVEDKQIIYAGRLAIFHGHEILRGASSPVSPARTLYMKISQSGVVAHTHKISGFRKTLIDGTAEMCWSTGCLCDLSPDYHPYGNDYALGFGHIRTRPDGRFSFTNYQIFDGEAFPA